MKRFAAVCWIAAAAVLGCSGGEGSEPSDDPGAHRRACDGDAGCARGDGGRAQATGSAPALDGGAPGRPYARWPDPLAAFARGREHSDQVCARGGDDPVRDAFCADPPAAIDGLRALYRALAIEPDTLPNGRTGIALTAHSTGLGIRAVSAINPRVFTVRLELAGATELLAIAFVRGEQLVELVVRDRVDEELRFYLVGFRQDCNEAPLDGRDVGCQLGDLLTPAIESDWREVTLYDERDVSNSVLDCAPCHQPQGPGTPKLLRMQERTAPWTHWMFQSSEGGKALLRDYEAAHGDETFAGYAAEQIRKAHPGNLAMLADFDGSLEPNPFDSAAIEQEVRDSAAARGGAQPADNSVPGDSATWQRAYDRARVGQAIAVPYHDVKVSDRDKLERAQQAYQAYRRGELAAEALPDLRDVYPDDPQRLAHMGMMTEPGADGVEVLLQACGQCHNERLDQSLSRARFRADLQGMSRAEKDAAIDRLRRPDDDPLAMPPLRLRQLSAEARARAIALLMQ